MAYRGLAPFAIGAAVALGAGCGQVSPDDAPSAIVNQLTGEHISYVRCDGVQDDGRVSCTAEVNGDVKHFLVSESGELEQAP